MPTPHNSSRPKQSTEHHSKLKLLSSVKLSGGSLQIKNIDRQPTAFLTAILEIMVLTIGTATIKLLFVAYKNIDPRLSMSPSFLP